MDDARNLDAELVEVDLLVEQAKSEAARHVARRAAAADKLTALQKGGSTEPKDLLELSAQLITLTKRAALMESQVDVLEGKRRALGRYRDAVAEYASAAVTLAPVGAAGALDEAAPDLDAGHDPDDPIPTAVSRMVMSAQEDLRREISRAMHDGPAQSLTNIVLQAQIVERLVTRDPASAHGEVRQLIAMVQQTLDATKSFIFDVRPMVLDDLGLLPTLRRAARERGRRAGMTVGVRLDGPGPAPADGSRERALPHRRRRPRRVHGSRAGPRVAQARVDRPGRGAGGGVSHAAVHRPDAGSGRCTRTRRRSPARKRRRTSCRRPSPR